MFSGRQLRKRSGVIVYPEEVLQNKVVALYFSASWCPPCQQFTPILKTFYEELQANELPFEVVFVSSDKTEEDLDSYMKESHGDWLAVPFGNEITRELKQRYHITLIPKLVVVDDEGEVVTMMGRREVTEIGPKCFNQWSHLVGVARGEIATNITKATSNDY